MEMDTANAPVAVAEPAKAERLEFCGKAFNQETARLEDADEACDDSVR